jgi:hypothetical protein
VTRKKRSSAKKKPVKAPAKRAARRRESGISG